MKGSISRVFICQHWVLANNDTLTELEDSGTQVKVVLE